MIKEIVQFVHQLPPDVFSKNLHLKEGLYMFFDIEEVNGNPILKNVDQDGRIAEDDLKIWTSKSEPSPFFMKCLKIQINTLPVSPQKIFNPDKKIFNSCSPFALSFTKKNYKKYHKKEELLKTQLRDQYFKTAEKYLLEDHHKSWFYAFKDFLVERLYDLLINLPEYQEAKDAFSINIFLKKADLSDFISTHSAYLKENVFNKAKYNVEHNGNFVGISDSLSGFNEKKDFSNTRLDLLT